MRVYERDKRYKLRELSDILLGGREAAGKKPNCNGYAMWNHAKVLWGHGSASMVECCLVWLRQQALTEQCSVWLDKWEVNGEVAPPYRLGCLCMMRGDPDTSRRGWAAGGQHGTCCVIYIDESSPWGWAPAPR